jgi:DNA-binding response OmpR family regulator
VKKVIIAENILGSVGGERSLFSRGGITVYPAHTSEDILALHRQKKADLIIADLALPVMGGSALITRIRGDASLKAVSIIMAYDGEEESRVLCRDAGANAVISKPVDATALFSRVSELIVVPQRKDMRALLRVSVDDQRGGGGPVFAASENISMSGMLLEGNHPYRPGDRLECSFHIGHIEVKVEARVVRSVKEASGRYRCGIQFVNLDTKTMIVIEQFVRSRKDNQQ